jgi:replicative DNA helicase
LKIRDRAITISAFDRNNSSNEKLAKLKKGIFLKAKEFLEEVHEEKGYNKGGDIINIYVKEYLKLPVNIKKILYCFKEGVEHKKQNVKLEPYMLGLWLGDGTSSAPHITNIDREIIDYLYKYATKHDLKITVSPSKKETYRFAGTTTAKDSNNLLMRLKDYNLIDNKHIPKDYLLNSREVRLQVLAGLLDSDGYLYNNVFEISQKNDIGGGILRDCDDLHHQI